MIGLGLWFIGVPSAALWGMLAMILRFVPYIGPPISAIFPLVLAAAVGTGWGMVLWTIALFLAAEGIVGQAIEPVVSGHSTGPLSRRNHRLGHLLDLALGTDRPHSGNTDERLLGRIGTACGPFEIP